LAEHDDCTLKLHAESAGDLNLKVAVVGMGKMGLLHASILNAIPEAELAALCDKSFLIRKFLKKLFKEIAVVNSVDKLSRFDLDAVYITTPIALHYPIAKTLYTENIAPNLFIEKTLASNFKESKELCELAQNSGGVNMVGYMRRFAVTFQKAKNLLEEKAIGEITSFKAYAYSSDFYGIEKGSKHGTSNIGVLRDLGCHAVDLALWFLEELKVERAKVEPIVSRNVEDSAKVKFTASNGVFGELDVSRCVGKYRMPAVGFLIKGSRGTISVNDDELEMSLNSGKSCRWFRHDLHDTVEFWLGAPEYFREDNHFVKSVLHNGSAEPDFQKSAKVDRLIDEIKVKAG